MTSLHGSTAFVTGAAGGIGAATSALLAQAGAAVVLADRDGPGAEAEAERIRRTGRDATAFALDVTDTAAVERLIAAIQRDRRIDLLVNAAGIYGSGAAATLDDASIERVMSVNFGGVVRTCRAVLPDMLEHGRGAIVNMSSLHALNGQIGAAHYAASKAAVLGWTRSLARETGAAGIRVNAVAPGPIDTPFWRGSRDEHQYEAAKAARVKAIPLGRLGSALEVAEVIVFLLSPQSAYITGQVLSIGGGEIM